MSILTLFALAMCWSLSVVLFRVGARGSVGRKLALVLVVEGLALATSGTIETLFGSPHDIYARHPTFSTLEMMLHALADCGMLVLYPPFLAAALRTRWTRFFSDRRARVGLTAGEI